MSNSFDPYYEWLGIPPKDQPPHHYRLLGIEIFEANVNVIERAADRQMAHVRTFQSGKNSRASQELLNKLSAAKVCLLNPPRKADYDSQLRAVLPSSQVTGRSDAAGDEDGSTHFSSELPIIRVAPRPRPKSQASNALMVGMAIIVAIIVVIVGIALLFPDQPPIAPTSTSKNVSPKTNETKPGPLASSQPNKAKAANANSEKDSPQDLNKQDAKALTPADTKPAVTIDAQPVTTPAPETAKPELPKPEPPKTEPPKPESTTAESPSTSGTTIASGKLPVPSEPQIEAASTKLREQFKGRLAAAKTISKRTIISAAILTDALGENDPASKYAALIKARDVAIEANDVWSGLRAVDSLCSSFDADPWTMRLDLMEKVNQKAKSEGARKQLAEAALSYAHEASLEEKFDIAGKLIAFGRRVKDYARPANARDKLLVEQKQLAAKGQQAQVQLKESPDDAAANATYGTYLCFAKEDWAGGLPYLVKGNNAPLAEAAKKEISGGSSADELLKIAENWVAWGNKNAGDEHGLLWRHCQRLLRIALPDLPGISKAKALDVARDCTTRMNQVGDVQGFGRGKDAAVGEFMRLYGHSGVVTNLASSRSGRWLVSSSRDDTLRVWDLTSGVELVRIGMEIGDITGFALLPDEERLVAVGQGSKVVTARLSPQSEQASFDVKSSVQDVAMSADGQRLLLTTYGPQWNVMACDADGKRPGVLPMKASVRCTDLSRSGSFAAIGDENNVAYIWDLRRGSEPIQLMGTATTLTDVVIAPNEELVAGSFLDGVILWNPTTGKEVNRVTLQPNTRRLAFSLDSRRLLASSSTHELIIINATQGSIVTTLNARQSAGSASSCQALAILPDGQGAATAGIDGAIYVWRLPD